MTHVLVSLRDTLTRPVGLLGGALALTIALGTVGWYDYTTTRDEFMRLVRAHADSAREAVAAAARASRAAARQAEAELGERLLDNARLLAEMDRRAELSQALLDEFATRNHLFRVVLFAADGSREVQAGMPGSGRGFGPGPISGSGPGPISGSGPRSAGAPGGHEPAGRRSDLPGAAESLAAPGAPARDGPSDTTAAVLLEDLFAGRRAEGVTTMHQGRRADAARLAAAVRRARGGVIFLNVDASDVQSLRQLTSLDLLLDEIAQSTDAVAYVVLEQDGTRQTRGVPPPELVAANRSPELTGPLDTGGRTERRLLLGDRPVLEVADVIHLDGPSGGNARLTLGMALDSLARAEQRTLWRLATTLTLAASLGVLAVGLVWLRSRYGALAIAHARAEGALRQRDRLAAMGELAASVAHEIRNPLNAIAMSAQRLEREQAGQAAETDDDSLALLGVIRSEAGRINRKVDEFLRFARPPALVLAPASLSTIVEAGAASVRARAQAHEITLVTDAASAGDAVVDAAQLREALDNLLRNALDATPDGGTIELHARSDAREHVILVRDTGRGIPPDTLPRIFDLYFTTKTDGTGVGLAHVHQVVSTHGGSIHVDSAPGAGTTVTIRLPTRSLDDQP